LYHALQSEKEILYWLKRISWSPSTDKPKELLNNPLLSSSMV
jgi:hypothetical protein